MSLHLQNSCRPREYVSSKRKYIYSHGHWDARMVNPEFKIRDRGRHVPGIDVCLRFYSFEASTPSLSLFLLFSSLCTILTSIMHALSVQLLLFLFFSRPIKKKKKSGLNLVVIGHFYCSSVSVKAFERAKSLLHHLKLKSFQGDYLLI